VKGKSLKISEPFESTPARVQDLGKFSMPSDFRGRPTWYIQLWWIVHALFFRTSPQFMYGYRRWLLRVFGAKIGDGVLVRPTVRVVYPWKLSIGDHSWIGDFAELYTLGPISVGRHAVVSQNVYLCTGSHDIRDPGFGITALPIIVEDEAWVAAGAFVFPGVTVGKGSVISARSVVRDSTEPYGVYAGHPAKRISWRKTSA
jgi:putative colanic acid biosynthesis acetyltransferase WcaF